MCEIADRAKVWGGTFNTTTSQITMFAPANAAFTSNIFEVCGPVLTCYPWPPLSSVGNCSCFCLEQPCDAVKVFSLVPYCLRAHVCVCMMVKSLSMFCNKRQVKFEGSGL